MMLPKVSARRMMALVAAMAASIMVCQWAWRMFGLRADHLSNAQQHQADAASERRNLASFEVARKSGKMDLSDPKVLSFERATRLRLAHQEAMALKYRNAARGGPFRPTRPTLE